MRNKKKKDKKNQNIKRNRTKTNPSTLMLKQSKDNEIRDDQKLRYRLEIFSVLLGQSKLLFWLPNIVRPIPEGGRGLQTLIFLYQMVTPIMRHIVGWITKKEKFWRKVQADISIFDKMAAKQRRKTNSAGFSGVFIRYNIGILAPTDCWTRERRIWP